MERVKFGQVLTVDKEVYKICPKCRTEIPPTMEYAYNKEWCPYCGLNLDITKKEDAEEKDFKYKINQNLEGLGIINGHSKYPEYNLYTVILEGTEKIAPMKEKEIEDRLKSC